MATESLNTKGEGREITPPRADTTPPPYPGSDYSFTLQAVMEMQSKLGELTHAVLTLTEQLKKHDEKLDTLSHKVHTAEVAVVVGVAILGAVGTSLYFLAEHVWSAISPLIKVSISR